jgi:hypothetical protein
MLALKKETRSIISTMLIIVLSTLKYLDFRENHFRIIAVMQMCEAIFNETKFREISCKSTEFREISQFFGTGKEFPFQSSVVGVKSKQDLVDFSYCLVGYIIPKI